MAKSNESQALKHIVKLCYHFIRMEAANKNIIIEWVNTNDQLAGPEKFTKFRNELVK